MTNFLDKTKQGDLYSLLESCSKEDLAPLVAYITNKFSNSLKKNTTYKKHNPDHTKYSDLIANEIRLYGGNTVSNRIARGGKGPEYNEILFDVCQKLDIPSKKEEIINNESNLLRICLPYGWESLNSVEQQAAVQRARKKYAIQGGVVAKTLIKGAISRVIAPPIIIPTLIIKAGADPAFKVTIPCAIHIAYLRWKVLKDMKEIHRLKIANTNTISTNQLISHSDSTFFLGETPDKPVLTLALAKISGTNPINWQPVSEMDNTGISHFNSLFQAIPSLVTNMHVAATQYVEINIPPEYLARVKDSTDELRAFTRDLKGNITEHAKLRTSDDLKKIVNAGVLLQITSVIVAQKHLADITQKLIEIKKEVDNIHQHQKNKRETDMTGAIDYFKQIAPSIMAGELRDAYQYQIEKYEGDLLSIRDHLLKDIQKLNLETRNLKDGDMFGTEGIKTMIEKHQHTLFNLYQQLFLCIRARGCGWQLLLAFPGTEEIAISRKQNIDESLAILNVDSDLIKQTITEMDKRIRSLSAVTNTELTLNQRKLDLLKWQDDLIKEVTHTRNEIAANISYVASLVHNQDKPTKFLLKIDNGKIVARNPL